MNFGLTEDQRDVRDMVRKFAEQEIKPIAADLDKTHRHPEEICRKLGEMGIMGVAVPQEYGGAGMNVVTYVLCMIEISKACAKLWRHCLRQQFTVRISGLDVWYGRAEEEVPDAGGKRKG